ncbi:hypothetical protein O4H49_11170 [Kiloniella laminariae]|uniref:Lipoprotein n=1 Tax=Kiloniella laminariae TaxID=454162 RepID=A0ABT4LJT6_9PROT|nr:hypothetical protein [Kiloniella laminariae]MCZ4281342.1 hypothetical protein [Kiloniella laminariae]
MTRKPADFSLSNVMLHLWTCIACYAILYSMLFNIGLIEICVQESKMKRNIHAFAGAVAFLTILGFWGMTVVSELFGSDQTIATVKGGILQGMFVLIPAMVIVGGSGMSMGRKRRDAPAVAKEKRMPLIAANGLLILLPAAFYLASKSAAGEFDAGFYTVQGLELIFGALNIGMMSLNIRDGLVMTGRLKRRKQAEKPL